MAKDQLYREDLMIYSVPTSTGRVYYLIEREPYEKEGIRKSVHVYGRVGWDAVFRHREDAERALNQFPSRAAEGEAAQQEAAGADGAAGAAATPAEADAGS